MMGLLSRIFGSARSKQYAGHEAEYWEERHAALAGSLRGPGRKDFDEQSNELDYQTKRGFLFDHLPTWAPVKPGHGVGPVRLLDAGCGPGTFTDTWLDLGYEVTGVDFSQTAVDAARDRFGDRAAFLVQPLAQSIPDGPFDVAVCIDVLFHVVMDGDWRGILRALADATAGDGILVIQETLDPTQPRADHTKWRSIADYRAVFDALAMNIVEHERYRLPGDGVTKDVIVVRHRAPGGPAEGPATGP